MLPDSFRNPTKSRLRTRSLVDYGKHVVQDPALTGLAPLPGPWFYLDNIMRGHFGHVLTEQLSHVWAWEDAQRHHPGIRALVFERPGHPMAEWEYRLLAASGIDRDDVVVVDAPVRVETLVAATPAYAIGAYVHPEIQTTYRRVGDALASQTTGNPRFGRVFLTRRSTKRACHNAAAVERLFADHEFAIVAPEEHDLADQVAMVRSADVVAGFAGSGLFHLALTEDPKHVVVIASETYPAANERQMAAFAGHRLDLVRCRSDVHTERFSVESFHSDFTFDLGRDGAVVRDLLTRS